MKIVKNIQAILLIHILLAIVSCGTIYDDVDQPEPRKGTTYYIGINMNPSRDSETRYDFNQGEKEENIIHTASLMFYRGSKLVCTKKVSKWNTVNNGIKIISIDDMDEFPDRVYAVTNIHPQTTFDPVNFKATTIKRQSFLTFKDKYAMSNSTYIAKSGKITDYTPVNVDDFHISEQEAMDSPVTIYLDRVSACITFKDQSSSKALETTTDGNQLKFVLFGWRLADELYKTRLYKEIKPEFPILGANQWNLPERHRSLWSVPCSNPEYINKNATAYMGESVRYYCCENTTARPTKIIIIGRIVNETKSGDKLYDLYKWHGQYYSDEFNINIKKAMTGIFAPYYIRTYKGSDIVYKSIADYIRWSGPKIAKGLEPYEAEFIPDVAEEVKKHQVYKKGMTDFEEIPDFWTKLSEYKQKVWFWFKGRTYYYAEIPHFENIYAIVRNNRYNIKLKSLTGLGTPVADWDKIIIPQRPYDSHMNIDVQIIPYRLEENTYEFNFNEINNWDDD